MSRNRTTTGQRAKYSPEVSERARICFLEIEKQKGLNRAKMAREMDITTSTLSRVMTGKSEATIPFIEILVTQYKVNANYLFTGEGDKFI